MHHASPVCCLFRSALKSLPPSPVVRVCLVFGVWSVCRVCVCVCVTASDQRTLGQQLCLWDMHTPLAARALNCSVGGRITCVQWSPSGQFLAVGGSSGCVVLVDTESWEQTPVCQVDGGGGGGGGGGGHGGVQQLCWVSAVDCVMVQQQQQQGAEGQGQGGLVYTLHLPDSGGGDRDRDLAGKGVSE